jgi:hypothetical protein
MMCKQHGGYHFRKGTPVCLLTELVPGLVVMGVALAEAGKLAVLAKHPRFEGGDRAIIMPDEEGAAREAAELLNKEVNQVIEPPGEPTWDLLVEGSA